MPARGEVWDKPTETASIGSCLHLVSGILGDRSLVLFPARPEGTLDGMLAKTSFPCYRMPSEVLPRLPALAAALAGRRSSPDELIKSVVDLSQESVTPANL
jgi:hypothetical protein